MTALRLPLILCLWVLLLLLLAQAAPPSAPAPGFSTKTSKATSSFANAALHTRDTFGGDSSSGTHSSSPRHSMPPATLTVPLLRESGGRVLTDTPETLAVGPTLTIPTVRLPTVEEKAEQMSRELEMPYVVALCYHKQMERRVKAGGPSPVTEERIRVLAACEQNNAASQRMPNGGTYEQFKASYMALTPAERQAYRDDFVQQMTAQPRSYPLALSQCMALKLFPDDGTMPPFQAPFTVILFFEVCKKEVPQRVPRKAQPPPPVPTVEPRQKQRWKTF